MLNQVFYIFGPGGLGQPNAPLIAMLLVWLVSLGYALVRLLPELCPAAKFRLLCGPVVSNRAWVASSGGNLAPCCIPTPLAKRTRCSWVTNCGN